MSIRSVIPRYLIVEIRFRNVNSKARSKSTLLEEVIQDVTGNFRAECLEQMTFDGVGTFLDGNEKGVTFRCRTGMFRKAYEVFRVLFVTVHGSCR